MRNLTRLLPTSGLNDTQRHLALVRFLGYIGAQFNFLLVPLLVFQLSGSAAVAGGLLLLEWLPKVGIYLVGGSLIQWLGERRMHVGLEAARALSFAGLAACAWLGAPLVLLGFAAGLYQCTNAISNVVFERAITKTWSAETRAQGQTMMLRQDQFGSLLALTIAWAWAAPAVLTLCALGLQTAVTLMVILWAKDLHVASSVGTKSSASVKVPLLKQLYQDVKAMQNPALWALMGFATLSLVCNATMLSGFAFLLERAQSNIDQSAWRAGVLLGKTVLALVVLTGVQKALKAGYNTWSLARVGLATAGLVMLGMAAGPSAEAIWLLVLVSTGMSSLVTPWLRTTRQKLVEAHVPASSRNGVTGILSSAEPMGYVVGGLLLGFSGSHLLVMCLACAACAAVSLVLGSYLRRAAAMTSKA